ncbi:hypothetical protein NBRC116493_05420 [Aurantivibrio infirmus]
MPSEASYAKKLVANAMQDAENEKTFDKDSMGRAIIHAVIEEFAQYRKISDIASELQYTVDNLDEDEFVITRGC